MTPADFAADLRAATLVGRGAIPINDPRFLKWLHVYLRAEAHPATRGRTLYHAITGGDIPIGFVALVARNDDIPSTPR